MSNPHVLSWANPTTRTDGTALALTDIAGYEIQIDSVAAVNVPKAGGETSFDLSTLAAYEALKTGSHTATLAVVDTGGNVSAFASPATFQFSAAPSAATSLAVA